MSLPLAWSSRCKHITWSNVSGSKLWRYFHLPRHHRVDRSCRFRMFLVVLHLVPLLLLSAADIQQHQANVTEKQLGGGFDCGVVLRGAEFRLMSPGYPLPAPRGLTCFYVIEAAHPSICFIELTFLAFDLGDCGVSGDTLEVAGQVLCGGTTVGTRSFRFNPPRSLIVFRSGEAAGGRGFEIVGRQQHCPVPAPVAQPDCSAAYTAPQFYIQSPTRRPTGRVCEYTIISSNRPSALCQTELLFENFDLEATAGCTGERLEVGDQDVLCGILTGTRIYSFISFLKLRYISTRESIGSGFRVLVVQKGCRQLVLSNNGGILPPAVPVPTPPPFQPSPPDLGPNIPHLPPIYPPVNPNIPQGSPLCCGIAYGSRHFYLTSPGFPYYNGNADKECVYRIRPSGPDICRVRVIFRFFWLGKEDSYIGCFNNGYLQLDDGQRICGCKTGTVLILPYFQGQEKVLHYRGYSGGGFLLELFQESCTDPGWFEGAVVGVPQVHELYPFSAAKERHGFNVTLKNAMESRIYDTTNVNNPNTTNTSLLSSDLSVTSESKSQERLLGGSVKEMNIAVDGQRLEMKVPHTDNALRFSEGGEQRSNLSFIKNALNKNCKVSWKFSVYEGSNKQVLPCSNVSDDPLDSLILKNESRTKFIPPEDQLMSRQDSKGASLSPSEDDLCNVGNSGNLTNKSEECRHLGTVDYLQDKENRRSRRGVYLASPKGNCYGWYNMVQEARRFLWVNGLPRTLCPSSRRCQVLAEAAGWFKIPGYPPAYPNNVHLCFG